MRSWTTHGPIYRAVRSSSLLLQKNIMTAALDFAGQGLGFALCHDGENLEACLNDFLKSPETIVSILSETFTVQSSTLYQLKCQIEDFSSQRKKICYDVLNFIREIDKLCQLCNDERWEKVDAEIGMRLREQVVHFNLEDTDMFPETVEFFGEMGLRLGVAVSLLTRFEADCKALRDDSQRVLAVAEDGEWTSKAWKRFFGVVSIVALVTSLVALKPAVIFGSAAFTAGRGFKHYEEQYREMKEKVHTMKRKANELFTTATEVKERMCPTELEAEYSNANRPRPKLLSVKSSVTTLFSRLNQNLDFTAEREKITSLLHDD